MLIAIVCLVLLWLLPPPPPQLQDEFISQKLPPRLEAFDAWLAPDTTDVKDQKKKGSSSSAKCVAVR